MWNTSESQVIKTSSYFRLASAKAAAWSGGGDASLSVSLSQLQTHAITITISDEKLELKCIWGLQIFVCLLILIIELMKYISYTDLCISQGKKRAVESVWSLVSSEKQPIVFSLFACISTAARLLFCFTKTVKPNYRQIQSDAAVSPPASLKSSGGWHFFCVISGIFFLSFFFSSIIITEEHWSQLDLCCPRRHLDSYSPWASPRSIFYLSSFCTRRLSETRDPL